jgi:2-oxo-4-hydroxy-4-carboxy--5-ureidoimidazoline (OHCU) decarboxylase
MRSKLLQAEQMLLQMLNAQYRNDFGFSLLYLVEDQNRMLQLLQSSRIF